MERWLVAATVVVIAAMAIDRALLGAEARGWLYYRRRRPPAGTASTSLLTILSIYQPGHERIVDERLAVDAVDEEDGEPPDSPHETPRTRGSAGG